MDTGHARTLFDRFSAAVAYIAVEKADGSHGIGTATHVGEGVFVTARHVVDGHQIVEVSSTEDVYIRLPEGTESQLTVHAGDEEWPAHRVSNGSMTLASGVVFHSDPDVDLAAFRVADCDPQTPWVPLGDHLDDWLGAGDFVLSEVIVMGYPPIPMTRRPYIVAARAEVNAQVDYYDTPHVHWILSTMARGGFSGAMAIDERGIALGVVGRSVLSGPAPEELGYMSATSIEPIYQMLAEAKMLPMAQQDHWDGFWNSDITFLERPSVDGFGMQSIAHVETFDDGQRLWLRVRAHDDSGLQAEAARVARDELGQDVEVDVTKGGAAHLRVRTYGVSEVQALERARDRALAVLEAALPGATRGENRSSPR
ncbi:S1 family peptidase [Nocardioides daeguensis]|uniref:Serine protease n=1 Tax=Nocardioides daeguensis TaxID=908359 RepID=A0ABP6WCK4_9ACTN|nr:serine protease [Nocardioides daeguensis]MBV6729794.1 serine protease [Nocardioides daeguensis]MCR1773550.1 serine protease [Nocardioides daeguensis]